MTAQAQAGGFFEQLEAGEFFGAFSSAIDYLSNPEESAYVGVICAFLSGLFVFLVVGIRQNRKIDRQLRRYRYAEPYLIRQGKLTVRDMVDYHSCYNWGNYSAIALSAAFVVGALQFGGTGQVFYVSIVSCTGLTLAGALMAGVDIVNTNTLSPLVPVTSRFRIIDKCIVLGGLGVTLAICSVIAFLSMVMPLLSIVCGIVFFFIMVYLTSIRALPRDELMQYFDLNESQWTELNSRIERSSIAGREPLACEPPATFRTRMAANPISYKRKLRDV